MPDTLDPVWPELDVMQSTKTTRRTRMTVTSILNHPLTEVEEEHQVIRRDHGL